VVSLNKNYEFFLKTDLLQFTGQWVAIIDESIVAHGKEFARVFTEAKGKFPNKTPFVAMVPTKTAMLY